MKISTTALRAFALSLLTSGAIARAQAPATVTKDSDDRVELPSFTVTEEAGNGYRASNSVSATRTNTPIADLPFAVSAFTQQFIADVGAESLMDVARYSAGVSDGSSEFLAGDSVFSIRGFKQAPEHDGFFETASGNIYVDVANIERIEVVKGPASLLYGQIQPGGTVNYITKRPQDKAFATISLQGGSYDFARTSLDVNQPLIANKVLFRINGTWENNYEYVKPSKSQTKVIDPSLTWNVSSRLTLKANYQWFSRRETPPALYNLQTEVSTPASVVNALNGALGYPAPAAALSGKTGIDIAQGFGSDASDPGALGYYPGVSKKFNYSASSDVRRTDLESVDAEADYTIAPNLISRLDFNYNLNRVFQSVTGIGNVYVAPPDSMIYGNGVWSVAPSWTALSAAQQIAQEAAYAQQILQNINHVYDTQNGTANPGVNPRRERYSETWGNNSTIQWEVAGDYKLSWATIKPLAGVYYDKVYSTTWTRQNAGSAAAPYFQAWDLNPNSPTAYQNHDTPSYTGSLLSTLATNALAFTSDQAAYGVVNMSFLKDTLTMIAGARYNRSESQATNYIAAAGTSPVGRGYQTHYTTPQAGLGYKLIPGLMLYASFSESYSLPAQSYLRTVQTVNGALQSVPTSQATPTTGKGYEAGIKTDFRDGRISSTLSVYDITQDNVVQTVNEIINGTTLATDIQQTQVTSKGVEYEITLTPIESLQIFASAAEDDVRNTKEPAGFLYYLGAHPFDSAKTLANLWSRYSFNQGLLKGAWIGAGFNYSSKINEDTVNAYLFLPSSIVFNAAVGYNWKMGNAHFSAVVNYDDIGNRNYYLATQVRALPERAKLSLTAKF